MHHIIVADVGDLVLFRSQKQLCEVTFVDDDLTTSFKNADGSVYSRPPDELKFSKAMGVFYVDALFDGVYQKAKNGPQRTAH